MHMLVTIPGMHCNACETLIRDISADFPHINGLTFDLKKKQVSVDYEDGFNLEEWSRTLSSELGPKYAARLS